MTIIPMENAVLILDPSAITSHQLGNDRMQINCPECGGKSIITTSKKLSDKVSDLYCSCKDSECGHTFVFSLSFKHSLSPSAKQNQNNLTQLLLQLDESSRQEIISQVQSSTY